MVDWVSADALSDIHPRALTSHNRPANNSTGWMNHMTQRRVTEIPEQFGQ
jgi:hypothetical protein